MTTRIGEEIAALKRMTVSGLRRKHWEVFGEATGSGHKAYLVKRLAWRMQANAEGGLSERALARARELENDADLRMSPPRGQPVTKPDVTAPVESDARLPMPGSQIVRDYKGGRIVVHVLPKGFEYDGKVYRSLSAVAKAVTGTHWNGYHFFGLTRDRRCA